MFYVCFQDVPPETAASDFTHVVVFTRSTLVEQTTPNAGALLDTTASVSGLQFSDLDRG